MRRFLLFLAVFLVVASAATGVHASTDCERWFIAYKNSLAQTSAAKHLIAAKHRAHRYVHRRLAAFHAPKPANKPKVLPARFQRPKMTGEEALRRFNLACGDMPEDGPTTEMVHENPPKPDYLADNLHRDVPLEKPVEGGVIAENVMPSLPPGGGGGWGSGGGNPPGIGGGFGGFGGGGTPPGTPTPHTPGTPTSGNPPPDAPPVSPVPEPGSIVLLLTGVAGAAGVVRRRFVR
ncbi:MAG TPA: PEP-CTERM sorting domain-containing protein [Terriglobales bacterium]|nr:PEP-CTERM sorting domain-containing protein [Terriglobales bacterium]